MEYSVYNKITGEIIRTGICPVSMFLSIESTLPLEECIINKRGNDITEKISNGKIISISKDEINLKTYNERKNLFPKLDMNLPLTKIDKQITDFFVDCLPDIKQWKKDNYTQLRKQAYPSIGEYLDTQVKINSRDLFRKQEGQKQLQTYIEACLLVKENYPKMEKE